MHTKRVLSRRGARELTAEEVMAVSGGELKRFVTTGIDGRPVDLLIVED